jgi:hypothetical protein
MINMVKYGKYGKICNNKYFLNLFFHIISFFTKLVVLLFYLKYFPFFGLNFHFIFKNITKM